MNNLYGVDIMEEAVEICKLRLFLKMMAQVDRVEQIEPLPDIDFNIRAGNTLVGYANLEEMKKSMEGDWVKLQRLPKIEESAEIADRVFQKFHEMQTEYGMQSEDFRNAKQDVRKRLTALEGKLNGYLAEQYGIDQSKAGKYKAWLDSHKPFHWFIEFYGIMRKGGFDVIIGNPPYLEVREVNYCPRNFECNESGAIHAMCIEQSLQLLHRHGSMSMVVPLSLVSTQRMRPVQKLLEQGRNAWFANYSWRPGKLFDTVNRALTIFVVTSSTAGRTFSTNYQRWNSDSRDLLMLNLSFVEVIRQRPAFWIPKMGDALESVIVMKCLGIKVSISSFAASTTNYNVYYRTDGGLYWKVFTDFAPAFRVNGRPGHSTRETSFSLSKACWLKPIIAIMSSDIFWWWYTITSNCRHLNPYDIQNFPIPISALQDPLLCKLGKNYLSDLVKNSTMLERNQRQTGRTEMQSFKIQKSKPIIDQIDRVLAKHYGFTDE